VDAALPLGDTLRYGGVAVVALLAAGAIVAPTARLRAAAMAGALVLTPILLVGEIWNAPQFTPVRESPGTAAAGGGVALLALAALAALFHRRPVWIPVLAVAALPFRLPIEAGGETANLLLPLYGVVGAGTLAFVIPALAGRRAAEDRSASRVEWLLGAFVALYGIQALYSSDFANALEQVVFFLAPFALLLALLRRTAWTPGVVGACFGVLVALALTFVAIGFWEYATRTLLFNPRVIASNEFADYFRVNSLFFDPNIYGRFLAVVMLLVAAAMLWTRRADRAGTLAALLVVLWAGLVLTFSQTSFAALLAGLAVLGALRWSTRAALGVTAAMITASLLFVLAAPGVLRLELGSAESLNRATTGRVDLIRGGVGMFADRPLTGHGSGAFAAEFRAREETSRQRAASASHTIPITVAAEQGLGGLAVYLALLWAAFRALFRHARHSAPRAAVAAAFAALVLHTMTYAAFLEDPITWTLLGAGLALAAAAPPPPPPPRRRREPRRPRPAEASTETPALR
jgi:O-antigen ligase